MDSHTNTIRKKSNLHSVPNVADQPRSLSGVQRVGIFLYCIFYVTLVQEVSRSTKYLLILHFLSTYFELHFKAELTHGNSNTVFPLCTVTLSLKRITIKSLFRDQFA